MPAKKRSAKKVVRTSPKIESTEHQYAHITHETPVEEPTIDTETLEAVVEATMPEVIATPETAQEVAMESEMASVSMEERRPRHKAWILILVLILLIMAGVVGVIKYQSWKASKNPSYAAEVKAKDLLSKVGALTELPTGENPTIAVVSDKSKLPKAPLFADAQNGDEVLVYTSAHKAYVYRPSTNKIIAIGPITIASNTPQTVSLPASSLTPVSVVVYNGTSTAGLAKKAQLLITSKDQTASVSAVGDAAEKTYTTTTVVDITGKHADAVKTISTLVGGTVGALPKTETAPKNTDVLVILGKDYAGK